MSTEQTQLVVTYSDHTMGYFRVDERGWRIDNPSRCIVIGKMPRTYVPLDQVRTFDVEAIEADVVALLVDDGDER